MTLQSKLIFAMRFLLPLHAATLYAQAPRGPAVLTSKFWIYEVDERQDLVFNLPWDEQPGDASINVASDPRVPEFARICLMTSEQALRERLSNPANAAVWVQLEQAGATQRITIIINVLPRQNLYRQLARLDREPYFWHWNEDSRVPSLALSNYRRGSFVWEAVATPETCSQPPSQNLSEYLNYAARRLAIKR